VVVKAQTKETRTPARIMLAFLIGFLLGAMLSHAGRLDLSQSAAFSAPGTLKFSTSTTDRGAADGNDHTQVITPADTPSKEAMNLTTI